MSENELLRKKNTVKDNSDSFSLKSFTEDFDNFIYDFRLHYRFIKKHVKKFINTKFDRKSANIIYLTVDCPLYMPKTERLDSPVNFVYEMRKQYPDININILLPIIGLSADTKISKKISVDFDDKFFELERTSINFSFFAGNKTWEASLYKFNKNEYNVTVYGIYSPAFSYIKNPDEIKSFDNLIAFLRAARYVVKNFSKESFKPDIVHSEFVPFFLGAEFEPKFSSNIKVLQIFDSFNNLEASKQEAFWSIINIADKKNIKKICNDIYIKNSMSRLFQLPIKDITPKIEECLDLIYDNYRLFHNTENPDYDNQGDFIFRQLNGRIKKLFPNIIRKGEGYYYPFETTLINCDYWTVYSETYYEALFKEHLASPWIMKEITRTADKSGFILPSVCIESDSVTYGAKIYNEFDDKNYRRERVKNKRKLVKEFSSDSLKTRFIDETIFKDFENAKIYGYLDSFYEAPLLFANPGTDIFSEGTDILFNSILKLFERDKNIQIIICIKNGLKQKYVKSIIDFLQENRIFLGRWVYIDGEVNLPKLLSAADMYLHPARICDRSVKHMLGYHYGCVPVVSNAGVLNDTVTDIFDNLIEGNGLKTKQSLLYEEENTNVYVNHIEKALDLYNNNPASWNIIVKNALNTNSGWDFAKLEQYNNIYQNIL